MQSFNTILTTEASQSPTQKSTGSAPTLAQIIKLRTLKSKKLDKIIINEAKLAGMLSVMMHFACYTFLFKGIRQSYQSDMYMSQIPSGQDEATLKKFLIEAIDQVQLGHFNAIPYQTLENMPLAALNQTFYDSIQLSPFADTIAKWATYQEYLNIALELLFLFPPAMIFFTIFMHLMKLIKKNMEQDIDEILISQNIDMAAAEQMINALGEDEAKLLSMQRKSQDKIIIYSNFGILSILGTIYFVKDNGNDAITRFVVPMIACIAVGFMLVSFVNMLNVLYKIKLDANVDEDKDLLKAALPPNMQTVTTIDVFKGSDEKSSFVSMTFDDYRYHQRKISAHMLCKIVMSILQKNNIHVTDYQYDVVILSHASLAKAELGSLEKELHHAIEIYKILKEFSHQIKTIMETYHMKGYAQPEEISPGIWAKTYTYKVNEHFTQDSLDRLQKIYPNVAITLENGYLEIKSGEPCKSDRICRAFKTQRSAIFVPDKNAVTITNFSMFEDSQKSNKKPPKVKAVDNANNKANNKDTSKNATKTNTNNNQAEKNEPNIVINWPNGYTYDSKDESCPVKVLKGNKLVANKFFVVNRLTSDDLKAFPRAYEKFSEMAKVPRLANGRKRQKGGCFVDEKAKDIHGVSFRAKFKFKELGREHGNEGVYGRELIAPTGERLYELIGFTPNRHRKVN